MRTVALLIAGASVAGCVLAQSVVGTDSVGPGYVAGGGFWSTGGRVVAVAGLRERDGQTLVCGAWSTEGQIVATRDFDRDVIALASVAADGSRLLSNLSFMRRLGHPDDLAGGQATCALSRVPWRSAFAEAPPQLRFRRIGVALDDDPSRRLGFLARATFHPAPMPEILP